MVEKFPSPVSGAGWSNTAQRTVERYSVLAVAEIIETQGTVCIVGRMTEVSRKGCYINTPSTLPVNSFLKVIISRDNQTFFTTGKVLYAHDGIGMGIFFVDPAEDQLQTLNSWLADAPLTYAL
jgi:hypothetical protein